MGAQLPFGPEDLKAPPLDSPAFIEFLHAEQGRRYPAPPPFYAALYEGRLSHEDLKLWVKDQYSYWDHGVVYSTGAIFVKTNDEPTRTHMLRKLVDIEGEDVVQDLSGSTTPAWEELWLRFGEGLGLAREEITGAQPFTRTHFAITTLCTYARYWDWTWLDGIASFYAADLHGRQYLGRAYAALQDAYGVAAEPLEFFRVYLDDVATHLVWEAEALAYWCCTTERQLTAARAFRERLDIEYQLLVGLESSRAEGRLAAMVP
jgi:pyrroloquinoline quinone (PQQ) biosynthesis protein C